MYDQAGIPERNPMLSTGLLQTGKGVPALPPRFTSGAFTDLAFLDIIPNIPLTEVIMQGNLRSFQYAE